MKGTSVSNASRRGAMMSGFLVYCAAVAVAAVAALVVAVVVVAAAAAVDSVAVHHVPQWLLGLVPGPARIAAFLPRDFCCVIPFSR